ncbi:Snakin-2 [Sesamum alatum]|uniref:Snakin-2 n=1 Tax=Sesamum alatum TaxID=300844 RepID=A0AAE1YFS9_9LAMI|nr:Snakin-2 [Sesamum alatum]
MPISNSSFAFLIISAFLFLSVFQTHGKVIINTNGIGQHSFADMKIDCGKECTRRCQLSSRQNLCRRACGTCCARCNCVPPGTSGNADVCPCYANMTTHGGRKKCP